MKIRNKKTGGVIDIPQGMENQMQQHLLQGGDPMELLSNKGKKAKLSGKKIKKRQDGGQAQQQGGDQQAQMQQLVQMAAQALSQGADPQQVAQMLVQKGVPQEVVQQVIQAAMQGMQQQEQQAPQEEQMEMKHGGALNSIKAPYVYSYEHGGFIPIAQYGRNENTGDTQLRGNPQEDIDYNQLYKDEISKRKPSEKTKQRAPNVNVSIVDYLASTKQNFDYKSREKLAKELGITNYTGAGDQNKELLRRKKIKDSGNTSNYQWSNASPNQKLADGSPTNFQQYPKKDVVKAQYPNPEKPYQYLPNVKEMDTRDPRSSNIPVNQQSFRQDYSHNSRANTSSKQITPKYVDPRSGNYQLPEQNFRQNEGVTQPTNPWKDLFGSPSVELQQPYVDPRLASVPVSEQSFRQDYNHNSKAKGSPTWADWFSSLENSFYNTFGAHEEGSLQPPAPVYTPPVQQQVYDPRSANYPIMQSNIRQNYNRKHGGFIPLAQVGTTLSQTPSNYNWNQPIIQNQVLPYVATSPNQIPQNTGNKNINLGKVGKVNKQLGLKSNKSPFKGQTTVPMLNMPSANPYLAKANYYRNQAMQDFMGLQKKQGQEDKMSNLLDITKGQNPNDYEQIGFDQSGNAMSMRPSDPSANLFNQDIWNTSNYQTQLGSKYGGLIHAQNGASLQLNNANDAHGDWSGKGWGIGAGVTSAMLADLNTAKGFTDIAGSMYQNSAVAGIKSEQRRANLIGQYQNTPPTFSDGWGGMQPLEGAYVPVGKYGGMMQNGGDMEQQSNGIPSKFTGNRHYEGGIPVNTDGSSYNANDMKTHRSNANLEVEGGEYFVPGMQNGGQAKNDVILSDRKNIGWNGMSPSENYEELTKAQLGISANKFNKGITKDEKFRADNVKFLSNKISEETAGVMQKLAVPVTNSMQELAQQTYLKQEQVKYGKGMDNDLESIMQQNQQPMAQYGAQIPDDMNYYDTGKMFMANGGSLPMAQNGITVSDKSNTYIKNNGKWYYYNDKKVGAEVPAKANIMTKEAWVKGGKGFNESSGGKSLDKLYSSLNKTNSTTSSTPSSTPAINPYAPYSINQTSQGNAKTETGQYITSPPIQTANWKDVIFPAVERNHPELRNKLIPEDPTRANALLQENMYDDALDRIQGIGAYEGATAQDKEAALAEFKRMWKQHGRVGFNSPGKYPDVLKNMANWKVDDDATYKELANLRGNFIDNKLERRYLLTPQGQSVTSVAPTKEEEKKTTLNTYKTDTTPVKQGINMPSFDINIPNVYAKKPITSYDVNPYFQQPHTISPYINDIQRLQYAANANLGTSGAELATRANLFGQGNTEYGKRFYDASVYNAGAKTQADAQNAQAAYTAANQNRGNQWQTESAQNQRDAAIQGQQELDRNSYLKSLTDKEHERMMGIAAKDIYNQNFINWQNYASTNLGTSPTMDETTYKYDKDGNVRPSSAKKKSKFGGKVNKLNTKKFKSKK